MSRADRIFRRLLRLFPADFRGDVGDDMAATFTDQRNAFPTATTGINIVLDSSFVTLRLCPVPDPEAVSLRRRKPRGRIRRLT